MRLPTIRQFRAFLQIAESGNVTAAARVLGLTQPAVSQQLQELERILEVRLFDRMNGRWRLTISGMAFIEAARRAVSAAEDAMALAAGGRFGETGEIRIGSGASGCIYVLPSVLAAVKEAMPQLTLKVTIGDTVDLLPKVQNGELDIALMTLPETPGPTLSQSLLFSEPLVGLVPAGFSLPSKTIDAEQFASLSFIAYHATGNTRVIVDSWFSSASVCNKPVMELGSFEAIKVLVGAGLGATILPKLALRTPVANTMVCDLNPPLSRNVGYVMRSDKIVDRGLRLLIQRLETVPSY